MKWLLCALIPAWIVCAQEFEVASIKPVAPTTLAMMNSGQFHSRGDNARFEESNVSLLGLITTAYNLNWNRISGPAWMDQQYFAVMAALPAGSTREQIPAMLQKLLADRFKLAVHHDQKVESVYLLVADKSGTKLKPPTADENARGCAGRPGEYACRGVTLAQLTANLSGMALVSTMPAMARQDDLAERRIDRPVVDETGLAGLYDIDLQWIPPAGFGPGRPNGGAHFPARDPSVKADSIFGAFEALGLKLQPGKHAFDTLMIDHVERVPTEN